MPEVTVEDKPARSEYAETSAVVAQVEQYEPASAAVEHVCYLLLSIGYDNPCSGAEIRLQIKEKQCLWR